MSDPLAYRRNPGADAARVARVPTAVGTLIKVWLKANPSRREALRAQWPELAEALDALTWRPAPEGVGAGTPQAPVTAQNRSEGATCAICERPTTDGHTHSRAEWFAYRTAEMKANLEAKAPGDMHEPRPYPASGLHFN